MTEESKPQEDQEKIAYERQSKTITDAHGKHVHAPKDLDERNLRVCQACNSTFRVAKTKHTARIKYCSHACRTQAYRLRKIAEENYLKAEIAALQRGETHADVEKPSAHERAERIREGIAMSGGVEPPSALAKVRDSRALSLIERVRSAEPFSPEEAQRMQAGIAELVEEQILQAHRVVMGTLVWSPVQARVFNSLLNKCVPDLSASYAKSESTHLNISEMSRDELERIVAAAQKTIDAEPVSAADAEEKELDE